MKINICNTVRSPICCIFMTTQICEQLGGSSVLWLIIRPWTKPPWDLIIIRLRVNLKIVRPYSQTTSFGARKIWDLIASQIWKIAKGENLDLIKNHFRAGKKAEPYSQSLVGPYTQPLIRPCNQHPVLC